MPQIKDIQNVFIEEDSYGYKDCLKLFKEKIDERTVELIELDYQPVGSPNLILFETGRLLFYQQFITYSTKFLDEED